MAAKVPWSSNKDELRKMLADAAAATALLPIHDGGGKEQKSARRSIVRGKRLALRTAVVEVQ